MNAVVGHSGWAVMCGDLELLSKGLHVFFILYLLWFGILIKRSASKEHCTSGGYVMLVETEVECYLCIFEMSRCDRCTVV